MATSTRSRRLKSKPPITPTPVTRRATRARPGAAAWGLKALSGAPATDDPCHHPLRREEGVERLPRQPPLRGHVLSRLPSPMQGPSPETTTSASSRQSTAWSLFPPRSNDTLLRPGGAHLTRRARPPAKALGWPLSAVIILGDVHYVLAARHAFPKARALSDTIRRGRRRRPRPSNRPATDEPQPPAPPTLTRGDSAALFPGSEP